MKPASFFENIFWINLFYPGGKADGGDSKKATNEPVSLMAESAQQQQATPPQILAKETEPVESDARGQDKGDHRDEDKDGQVKSGDGGEGGASTGGDKEEGTAFCISFFISS